MAARKKQPYGETIVVTLPEKKVASPKAPLDGPVPRVAGGAIEPKLVAFAEQLGKLLGTVQAKADGWLDPKALKAEVVRIRDGAAELLDHMNREYTSALKAGAKAVAPKAPVAPMAPAASAVRPSRGAVDAPGKRHRKPPPQELLNKRMGEPVGKKMGQKSGKNAMRHGRG